MEKRVMPSFVTTILVLIYLLHFLQLQAQLNYTGLSIPYDPCAPCSGPNINYQPTLYFNNPDQVASDFGPRYVVTSKRNAPYDWHGGIDYNGTSTTIYNFRSSKKLALIFLYFK